MATTAKTKAKRSAARKSARASRSAPKHGESAIDLLEQDHFEVEAFFEQYEGLKSDKAKGELAAKICLALEVHTRIEEEIFYPAAREATGDDDLLDEATVEHAGAKHLIQEIEAMQPGDELYDAKVKVLGEQIHHHVEEERDELFPEVRKAKLDLESLGQRMAERKAALMAKTSRKVKAA